MVLSYFGSVIFFLEMVPISYLLQDMIHGTVAREARASSEEPKRARSARVVQPMGPKWAKRIESYHPPFWANFEGSILGSILEPFRAVVGPSLGGGQAHLGTILGLIWERFWMFF